MRRCNNGTWSGSHPECVVNSVLPKQWLVLLIVGVTVALFALVIPYDFHKFRKRKRECREKQQHVNLMVRIQPFHAKNMGAQSSFSEDESEPTRRSFGIGSILAFFRLVKKKRNQKKNPPPETPSDAVNNISSTTPTNPGPVLQNQIPTVSLHHEQLPVIKPVPPIVPKTRTKSDEDHPCRKKDDIPHRLPRAKSLGNGIGRTVSVAVGPRSATFPNAKTNRGFENNGDISPRVSGDVSPNLSQDALRRIPEHLASCQDHASVMEPSGEVFPEELPPSKETSPKSVETSPVLSEDFAAEQYPSTAGHLSLVDELMDERGSDYGGRKRSQTSHPAAPAPRSLSLNMNRYKAKKSPPSRSKSSSSRPYVGSSPSHMMDMGF